MTRDLTHDAIRAATEVIPAEFRGSPQFVSDELSGRADRHIVVKVDAVNPIGSFKGRVVASTGNFGQAMAYAGRAHSAAASWAGVMASPERDGAALVVVTGSNVEPGAR